MRRKEKIFTILLIALLLSTGFSVVALAGDQMITINSDWQGSIFGNVGGQNKITEENFEITENGDGSVKLRSGNNRGKIESKSEGIAYYFKEIPADANFEFRATAAVESFDMNNQVSFGIMLRDRVLYNENNKDDIGFCLALGPLEVKKELPSIGFYRTAEGQTKLGELVNDAVPGAGSVYELSIRKMGNSYLLKFGNEEPVIINDFSGFESGKLYAGLYTARNTTVTFSNVKLSIEGHFGAWQKSIFGNVGGQNKITAENFEITEKEDGSVKLRSSNNRGKIESKSEGIAYYFKETHNRTNFEITAKAEVESFDMNNQVSFGLMVRDKVLYNENNKEDIGYCLAVGPLDVKKDLPRTGFYRTAEGQTKLGELVNDAVPAVGNTYDLSIKKSGKTYVLNFGNEEPVVLDNFEGFEGNTIYVGLYTSRNTTVTFSDINIEVDNRKVEDLLIDTSVMKTNYLLDEELETAGLKVTAVYSDSEKEELSEDDFIVSGFDSSKIGINTITINYNGVTKTIDLNINPLTCTALKIKYYPAKTDYYPGDIFDPEGFAIIADYNDGYKTEVLPEDKYTFFIEGQLLGGRDYIFDSPGKKNVTIITAETPGVYTDFEVDVKNAELSELEISKLPEKMVYFIGEKLDLAGILVYAKYSDGNRVRLMPDEYSVSNFVADTPGEKEVIISHKGEKAVLKVTVKEKELIGIEITSYPVTTFYTGEDLTYTELEVSKVYDNQEKEVLVENEYKVDASDFNKTRKGLYQIRIIPEDKSILPINYKVTVREKTDYDWKVTRFGQSAKDDDNFVEIREDGTIEIASINGGGKVATDHDGISFYYTEIAAEEDNFVLSADIKVIEYAKNPHDGQEAFGIMARDTVGETGDTSVFASNMVGIGGFSGGTKNPIGTQLFMRTGVESPDGAGSNGTSSIMINKEKPVTGNTYPEKEYRLTLAKTNSGYTGSLNDGEEVILFEPDFLNVQNSRVYIGFFAARVAHIEVSNIDLTVTAAETDPPAVKASKEAVKPVLELLSLDKTSSSEYSLILEPNVNGTVNVKQGQSIIVQERAVEAGQEISIPTTISKGSMTNFSITFLPDDTQYLTSYNKMVLNFTIEMRTYVEDGDIYVSPTGQGSGKGTFEDPLDLDTAAAFVSPGQKIILLDGRYLRSSKLEIKKYNDGTAEAMKWMVAADGARPVIDFDKKSEGVILSGNYWHIKGLEFTNSAPNEKGFAVGGSHNIIEECFFYENGDTGLQISRTDIFEDDKSKWPSHNLILNCTSFDNRDPSDNNADGFAAKLTSGEGNRFKGCISHHNIDDGWDLYTKVGTGAIGPVVIEDCIAYNNGTLTDGTVGNGDKNGFKLGGEGVNVPHIIKDSIAFGNGAVGFTSNSNPGVIAVNNIGFNNIGGNLEFTTYQGIIPEFKLDGFISFSTKELPGDRYPQELAAEENYLFNGFVSINSSGIKLTADNFVSLEAQLPFDRDPQGNIIRGDFLQFIPSK